MTYNEAEQKIFDAYFKDEIKPFDNCFCFCGTLSPNHKWRSQSTGKYPYTVKEYILMETALFDGMDDIDPHANFPDQPNYEKALFNGMCEALEVLKQIHISRGETIDGNIGLNKRELLKV